MKLSMASTEIIFSSTERGKLGKKQEPIATRDIVNLPQYTLTKSKCQQHMTLWESMCGLGGVGGMDNGNGKITQHFTFPTGDIVMGANCHVWEWTVMEPGAT